MDKNSNLKSGIISFLTNMADLMILNLLWIVCSLPIVTIGPATSAVYSVIFKDINKEPVGVLKGFFKAFKNNFKQAMVIGAFLFFIGVIAFVDGNFALSIDGFGKNLFIVVTIMLTSIFLIIFTYVLALVSRFDNTIRSHMINGFKLAFTNPLTTIIMWLCVLAPILIYLYLPYIAVLYIGWAYILFAVSLPIYICSRKMNKIFISINNKEVKQ